ncbi:speckle targeted PIP5K1A-regulated poly(A) polymerase [Drosophila rhopaloa]|uniref:Speckle targeted PIP5K1A-regulated poly(A) polymerase n=1 Tax=Drosophila rhopaloa TaxID=1041015 RepID=A0ABM5HDT4_DRORH|nr:speckle targeted PIP5K1A-regulated poly(A) polymerase [Drosophila rhopaloa]XP_044313646.1 speckle targeted PIP5K1A-regulated poly(A) polymerase [Drosophila rhopaloa]
MPAPASEITPPPGDVGDNMVLCMVCAAPFQNMQDCLAHELLKHASKPQKQMRQRLNAITKLFTSAQAQSERNELREALEKSAPGGHLRTVLDFFASDLRKMEACFGHVRNCIEKEMRGRVRVFPFGSLVTGLALKESDIDLYLQPCGEQPPMFHKQLYNKVSYFLRRSKCFEDICTIRHARVPIIRCKHQLTGLNIDINMSNPNSTYNSRFIGELMFRDERVRELGLFLKIWARKLKLIGHGSMTSYCLVTLIIVNLQVHQLLPSVKQLQSLCPPVNMCGVNYAYSLDLTPPVSARLTTLELLKNFFVYYSTVNFEKSILSPFLGSCLDKEITLGTPGGFPEYDEQMQLMQDATGEPPEAFQLDRAMCVQDPFELQHNVAKSVSQSNLCYIRQCIILAAQACSDQELTSQPEKLYDYLLFGLADKLVADRLVADKKAEKATPRKQQKIEVVQTQPPVCEPKETNIEMAGIYNAPPIVRSHVITPTTNDLKCLRSVVLSRNKIDESRPIYYYWLACYVDTIKDVLTQLYALNIELKESEEPGYYKWLISISYDTYSGRSFQRGAGQSFFAHQLQQTIEFSKTRVGNPQYAVNLRGYFSLLASEDYKELRLDVQPLPGDLLGLQRNSPLTKLFKAFKNLLGNYSFKEKASTWEFCAKSDQN